MERREASQRQIIKGYSIGLVPVWSWSSSIYHGCLLPCVERRRFLGKDKNTLKPTGWSAPFTGKTFRPILNTQSFSLNFDKLGLCFAAVCIEVLEELVAA